MHDPDFNQLCMPMPYTYNLNEPGFEDYLIERGIRYCLPSTMDKDSPRCRLFNDHRLGKVYFDIHFRYSTNKRYRYTDKEMNTHFLIFKARKGLIQNHWDEFIKGLNHE